jgi:hypothetical protein
MPNVLKGALDPRVTPGGILFRHSHDQAANLGENTLATGPLVPVRPLPDDELPMPPQNRVWCHDGGYLTQELPSQPVPPDRQATPVGVSELDPLLTKLAPQDAILLHQIRERLPLLVIQPASEDR